MRPYLDTSVFEALTDREDPRRVEITRRLFRAVTQGQHAGVISNVVQEELELAPTELRQEILQEIRPIEFELVVEDAASRSLFMEYVATRVVPLRFRNDLRHVAVATATMVDALVSWNFRHLVNVRTRRAIHAVNLKLGQPLIEIVSPEEV